MKTSIPKIKTQNFLSAEKTKCVFPVSSSEGRTKSQQKTVNKSFENTARFNIFGNNINKWKLKVPSSVQIKNDWSYTPTSLVCLYGVDGENFYLLHVSHCNGRRKAEGIQEQSTEEDIWT
jgi:hypothetical protein